MQSKGCCLLLRHISVAVIIEENVSEARRKCWIVAALIRRTKKAIDSACVAVL